jgi:hypothetical protein
MTDTCRTRGKPKSDFSAMMSVMSFVGGILGFASFFCWLGGVVERAVWP